jgi:serine protease Do
MDHSARAAARESPAVSFLRMAQALIATLLMASAPAATWAAAALTPQLQQQLRAATFEVVIKKPVKDLLTYEKPLPLELIPYIERTDAYWPVGTAFAIAPDTFVTAAHVIISGVGSQFGVPGIRDSQGKVYSIDRILKFAMHEDFVVFTVNGAPAVTPFATSTTAAVDDAVFAVGNALGEGVVVRDGLLTSLTPEPQDGLWKYLRFSAAASPGNSGGPLLDIQGRVIGVVIAKSPNENLNYALPIEHVLEGSDKLAVFDTRRSFGIPSLLQGSTVGELKDSFALPLPFEEFSRKVSAALLKFVQVQEAKLVAETADLFPKGASGKLLATLYGSYEPCLVEQQEDRSWDVHSCSKESETPLPGDGRAWICQDAGPAQLFRLQYPGSAADEHHYHDSREFMDLLLKAVNVPRMVGTQPVRITSLGAAQRESVVRDHFGRPWQLRIWSLGYSDAYVVVLALPTPDGYVGLMTVSASTFLDGVVEGIRFVSDYLYLTYTGSLAQWRAFLDRRELRPAVFDRIRLQYDPDKGVRFDSPRLQLDSSGVVTVGAQSSLDLQMAYMLDQGKLVWDVGAVVVREDRDKHTYLGAYRQPKPADDAGKERRERWEHMSHRDGDFTGTAQHDDQLKSFWIRTVAQGASAGAGTETRPLYELVYSIEGSVLPRQMEEIQARLPKVLRVAE